MTKRIKEGDRVYIEGDSSDLWIDDYNVRVSTQATVMEMPKRNSKKILVMGAFRDNQFERRY